MKVTYVHHSCFCIELERVALVFDYFKGQLPQTGEKTYFFASHAHGDHFSFSVFDRAREQEGASFIFSKDIGRKWGLKYMLSHGATPEQLDKIIYMKAGETAEIDGIYIETLKSTDQGVAFIVQAEGKTIYHAGDLNLWLWPDDTPQEAEEMRSEFSRQMNKIRGREFDLAFLPLDPRQGDLFYLGFDSFMKTAFAKETYPMHCWEDFSVIDRLCNMECSVPYRSRIRRG